LKAVILAGGIGSRLSEETAARPKPMVEIGGKPILWHIMKIYAAHGVQEFVICLGYRGYMIKEYFANYYLHTCDVTFDFTSGNGHAMQVHQSSAEPWKVTLVDTGEKTNTGGRLKRVMPYVGDEEFLFTYGDGVTDLDVQKTIEFHRSHDGAATVTAVQPGGRFGALDIDGDRVQGFREKPVEDGGWINGGFFVLSPRAVDFVAGDDTSWESEAMPVLAERGELRSYRHDGFWYAMDTVRDRNHLQDLWATGEAPWKIWP
jgi:glucose-1-phosphate cytidylyltransferase